MTRVPTFSDSFVEICQRSGSLADRLIAFSGLVKNSHPEFAAAYEALVTQLKTTLPSPHSPGVGDLMPPFLLPDQNGRLTNMAEELADGPLVITFNRGHWCEYCQLELRAYSQALAAIKAHGANVVSIMPEKTPYTRLMIENIGTQLPVLSDMDNAYALELGLVCWLGNDVSRLLKSAGVDLERSQGNSMWFVPVPASFVVSQTGRILLRHIDPDFRNRMEVDGILSALNTN